jgi:Golgi SNAP receptor complex protein 2
MNALYTHALRQTQSITADLALLESSVARSSESASGSAGSSSPYGYGNPSPSLQGNGVDTAGLNGQIVASLAALQRTVEDYEGMAKRELVEANKAKAQT